MSPDVLSFVWRSKLNPRGKPVAYSGVADLILAILPWKIIWYLPVKRRDKVGLIAVMSLGVL